MGIVKMPHPIEIALIVRALNLPVSCEAIASVISSVAKKISSSLSFDVRRKAVATLAFETLGIHRIEAEFP